MTSDTPQTVEETKRLIMAGVEGKDIAAKRQNWLSHITWQDGPIGEVGVNGLQLDDVIAACIVKLEEFQERLHSPYNESAVSHLRSALFALEQRTADREDRDVEGTEKA